MGDRESDIVFLSGRNFHRDLKKKIKCLGSLATVTSSLLPNGNTTKKVSFSSFWLIKQHDARQINRNRRAGARAAQGAHVWSEEARSASKAQGCLWWTPRPQPPCPGFPDPLRRSPNRKR